jgi:hypothetical protein
MFLHRQVESIRRTLSLTGTDTFVDKIPHLLGGYTVLGRPKGLKRQSSNHFSEDRE